MNQISKAIHIIIVVIINIVVVIVVVVIIIVIVILIIITIIMLNLTNTLRTKPIITTWQNTQFSNLEALATFYLEIF